MRKGNLVPLSLPAGGHRDLGQRINRAPPCPSGQPDSSHAPAIWHPGERAGGLAFPRRLCSSASQGSFCTAWVRCCLGPPRLNPEPFLFPGFVNQPVGHGAPGASGFRSSWSLQTPRAQQLRSEQTDPQGMENAFVSAAVGGGGRIKRFPGWPAREPRGRSG